MINLDTRPGTPSWPEAMRQAIASTPWAPYHRPSNGVSETVLFRGQVLIRADAPPVSYCSGAQFQAWVRAVRLVGLNDEDGFEYGWMKRSRLASYCRTDIDSVFEDGLPGFLIREGVATRIAPEDAQPGDLVQ